MEENAIYYDDGTWYDFDFENSNNGGIINIICHGKVIGDDTNESNVIQDQHVFEWATSDYNSLYLDTSPLHQIYSPNDISSIEYEIIENALVLYLDEEEYVLIARTGTKDYYDNTIQVTISRYIDDELDYQETYFITAE